MRDVTTDDQRAAMLSVYYHALGRRLELRGAPAVLLPSDIEPIPLGVAIARLRSDPRQVKRALWTVARAIPAQGGTGDACLVRYPVELLDVLTPREKGQLVGFEQRRRRYLPEAHRLGDALATFADTADPTTLTPYIKAFESSPPDGLSAAIAAVEALGNTGQRSRHQTMNVFRYLKGIQAAKDVARQAEQLRKLSDEVGLPLPTYIEEFAYGVAFAQTFHSRTEATMTVLPTSAVTVQDARSLLTTITVTALVKSVTFKALSVGMDPQCWSEGSDAFEASDYLDRATYQRRPRPTRDLGRSSTHRLLEERVRIVWGLDKREIGSFRNLLNTKIDAKPDVSCLEVTFDLNRCLSSRILWDVRPGGILIDEGYAKARPAGPGLFRVTVRKTLQFSDRTPYGGGAGWNDLGQMLNFLAPAAMSWWLEGEMYNQAQATARPSAPVRGSRKRRKARAGVARLCTPLRRLTGGARERNSDD
jgi:hypothetical protein